MNNTVSSPLGHFYARMRHTDKAVWEIVNKHGNQVATYDTVLNTIALPLRAATPEELSDFNDLIAGLTLAKAHKTDYTEY